MFPFAAARSMCALVLLLLAMSAHAAPQGSAITYQGLLKQGGAPVNGLPTINFRLFDALSGGAQIGSTVTKVNVPVVDGRFSVDLDFGNAAFDGQQRFLQITVSGATLSPRVVLNATPYAIKALGLTGGGTASPLLRGQTLNFAAPPTDFVTTGPDVGVRHSVLIGSDGLPLIVYYANAPGLLDLKVAHCEDTVCSQATINTIDSAGDVGDFNSMAMGSNELPVISYYDRTNGDLKIARCLDLVCSTTVIRTLDTLGDVGQFTSIVTTNSLSNSQIGIAYYDATNRDLKYISCSGSTNVDCATPVGNIIDSAGDVGQWASIIRTPRFTLIAYHDATLGQLKMAVCVSEGPCPSPSIRILDTTANSGQGISIATTPGGRALLVHNRASGTGTSLYAYVHCEPQTSTSAAAYCISPTVNNLSNLSNNNAQARPAILLTTPAGQPLVIKGFGLISCDDPACAGQVTGSSPMGQHFTATFNSAAIGADGMPILVYQEPAGLAVVHCANAQCWRAMRR